VSDVVIACDQVIVYIAYLLT